MPFEIPESVKTYSQFFHPAMMWMLLALTSYALYLGLQWRRTRTAEGEQKKELLKGKFNVKHYQVGSVVLVLMVIGSIGGMAVTYLNNGKLFVGPHLIAGLGMTGLIALSAGLSPFMQKGQDWARYSHILINVVIMGLFGWQAVSGMDIVQRILSRM
jgi:cytochrome bd-type quinol oxidase subunit 2